ncbi:hypothetical protein B0H66DRAFT_212173 [Apodospora peruviana]|uniref:Heterokaryon incompatibility domain-containing protein n=1 Tax=Apodospora peruviana TaxID=516989 RepID=A0AAE0M7Z5_9PEZI|nr:hypothetical protein B0H66DRAFT_212173 [Apodospora peruviana]
MDILCEPETPSRPIDRTRYVCVPGADDRWDGGPFLTYAHRKGLLRMVPLGLRHLNSKHHEAGKEHVDEDEEIPFTELIHPTPLDEQHSIYTTWFFVGLLSEFLGANRQENPERPPDDSDAEGTIQEIYQYFITTDEVDGNRYLTGKMIHLLVPTIKKTVAQNADVQGRLDYLSKCLRLSSGMLSGAASKQFDRSIKFALAGLGELMAHVLQTGVALDQFGVAGLTAPLTGFDWKWDYLTQDSPSRQTMVAAGWCRSDLGRANSIYQRLFTAHYLSLLDRHIPGRDHSACTETKCQAAQINNDTYKLSHATEGCDCREFVVDIVKVKTVLTESDTYPILVFDPDDETAVSVQPFRPGKDEYVALSHVWADGLGNTQGNTLQKCQIARLGRLIEAVEDSVHASNPSQPRPKYHLWIDTLCCPVAKLEPYCNMISLTRMKTVYEKATHVLVLDLALSVHDAETLHPATLLLRIFASSIWMRRLWTLQEGVLAGSLFFQFRDKPIHAKSLLPRLLDPSDHRYWILWADLNEEWSRLNDLNALANGRSQDIHKHKMYRNMQGALDFRNVTYPSDEPICIATLLGFDLSKIVQASDSHDSEPTRAEKRMCELWRLLSQADDGIPARMIFIVDEPLSTPGFGWAPRSLLGDQDQGGGTRWKTLQFTNPTGAKFKEITSGELTPHGLAVRLPGLMLESRPLCAGMALHAWDEVLAAHEEDIVYFWHEEEDIWYRMIDWVDGGPGGPPRRVSRDMNGHEIEAARPLCSAIDTGKIALIKGEQSDDPYNVMLWLMVQVLKDHCDDEDEAMSGYRVRWLKKVVVSQVNALELYFLQTSRKVALEVAAAEVDVGTKEFVRVKELGNPESEEYKAAREGLRQKMKDAMAVVWKSDPLFSMVVERTISEGMEEYIWASSPKGFSHDRVAKATPMDQRWFVD